MRTRRAVPALAVLLATTALVWVPPTQAVDAGAGPGDLFPGFTPIGGEVTANSDITAVAVQSTGKIIIAQRTSTTTVLRRLHADGTADASFGDAGTAPTNESWVEHLMVLPDDRILVADESVRQFTADGWPDTTFSGDGVAPIREDPGYQIAYAQSLHREPDGDVVVVGEALYDAAGDWDAFAQKWRPDGSVDAAFRSEHSAYIGTDVEADNLVSGALPDPGGGYHVLGHSSAGGGRAPARAWHLRTIAGADGESALPELPASNGWTWIPGPTARTAFVVGLGDAGPYLAKLVVNPAGLQVDPTWGTSFQPALPLPAWAEAGAVQPDGKIILATGGGLVRVHPDGRIDDSFASTASTQLPWEGVADIELTSDGGVVAAGWAEQLGTVWRAPRLDKYVGRLADVSTSITHTPAAGLTQQATVTYRNTGPDPASRAQLVVQVPSGTQARLTPSRGSCAPNGNAWTCALGEVLPGAEVTVQAVLTSTTSLSGILTATGTSELFDPDTAGQRSSVNVTTTAPSAGPSAAPPPAQSPPSSLTLTTVKRPTIKGTGRVGARLRATTGTWNLAPTAYTYRWLRNGKAIKKATARTYRVTLKDRGKRIAVRVTATKPGHTLGTATSRSIRVRS